MPLLSQFATLPYGPRAVAEELLTSKSSWAGWARSAVEGEEKRSYDVRPLFSLYILTYLNVYCLVAFKVYDMDRDNYISNGELFLVLKMMVGNNLKVRRMRLSRRGLAAPCPQSRLRFFLY